MTESAERKDVVYWCEPVHCCNPEWEAAYNEFETRAEEQAKFRRRFRKMSVDRWPKELRIVDLFCGRGSGMLALEELGFQQLRGVDLSDQLLLQYTGSAELFVGDCRRLHFEAESQDAFVVQGGLHHLPDFEADLPLVLQEMNRVLVDQGRVFIVEPWLTPFLRFVHSVCRLESVKKRWKKLDALARMNDGERETYDRWLSNPQRILEIIHDHLRVERQVTRWGKLMLVARKK